MVTVALYKGPATGWLHQAWHRLVCWWTKSAYSHCELVIAGTCYSSSNRDGGVRAKVIDLTSGRWDLFELEGDELAALAWFANHAGNRYDWLGVARFVLPFVPHFKRRWFCSEACAAALLWVDAPRVQPNDFALKGLRRG